MRRGEPRGVGRRPLRRGDARSARGRRGTLSLSPGRRAGGGSGAIWAPGGIWAPLSVVSLGGSAGGEPSAGRSPTLLWLWLSRISRRDEVATQCSTYSGPSPSAVMCFSASRAVVSIIAPYFSAIALSCARACSMSTPWFTAKVTSELLASAFPAHAGFAPPARRFAGAIAPSRAPSRRRSNCDAVSCQQGRASFGTRRLLPLWCAGAFSVRHASAVRAISSLRGMSSEVDIPDATAVFSDPAWLFVNAQRYLRRPPRRSGVGGVSHVVSVMRDPPPWLVGCKRGRLGRSAS